MEVLGRIYSILQMVYSTRAAFDVVVDGSFDQGQSSYARSLIAGHFAATEPVPSKASVAADLTSMKSFWLWETTHVDKAEKFVFENEESRRSSNRYAKAVILQGSRTCFKTEDSRVGLGPVGIEPKDVICSFAFAAPLFVLRFSSKAAQLIGDAYVCGLMDLNRDLADRVGEAQTFTIR